MKRLFVLVGTPSQNWMQDFIQQWLYGHLLGHG
jgi:hypothetical protein